MIPFVPMSLEKAIKVSRIFKGFGNAISKAKPSLKLSLYQAELDVSAREYASMAIFTSFFYFIILYPIIFFVGYMVGVIDFFLPSVVGLTFSIFVFSYLLRWPKLISSRKVKVLERDLLGALQHILVQIKSGVPLFNALLGVSKGYGKVSNEFEKVIKEINSGKSELEALEEASKRNPSIHFRRAILQITNAMKSGSDITRALEAVLVTITADQVIAIRKYAQELNPYTMMYMLIAVIMPTLGITFLIIMSSFSGIVIPKIIFPFIIVVLSIFQYFYMGVIKTKRPYGVR